jgi:hypothetical protein
MNAEFRKRLKLHFGVLEVTCYVATLCWQLYSAVLYTVKNAWADSLRTSTLYIAERCNAIGLTRSLTHSLTYRLLDLNIEDCFIRGDGSELDIYKKLPLCVRDLFGFKLYQVSRVECIWNFVLPFVNSTSSWATLVNVNWLFLFVVQILNFRLCTGL